MNSNLDDYFEVLNIPSFLYADNSVAPKKQQEKIKIKVLVVESQRQQSCGVAGAEQDFLFKMLQAIGVNSADIICCYSEPSKLKESIVKYDAKIIVLTNEDLSLLANNCFEIAHPSKVLADNKLKRDTWEVLKKIQKCLQ